MDRALPLHLRRIGDERSYTPADWPYDDAAGQLRFDHGGPFGHAVRFNGGHIFGAVERAHFAGTVLDLHGRRPFTLVAWVKFVGRVTWSPGSGTKAAGTDMRQAQAALFGGLFGQLYPWPGARSRHRRDRARLAALYGWCGGVLPSACSAGAETAQLQPGIDAGRLRQGEALRQGADMPASSAAVRCGRSAPAGSVPLGDGPCRAGGEGAARVLDGAVHPSSDAGRVRRQGEVTHRMFEASKPGVEMMFHVGWGQRT